jgi:thioredoxin-related protein
MNIFLRHFLLVLFLFVFANTSNCIAQSGNGIDTLVPYQKNKNLPSFDIRLLDSVTILNTKSIVKGKPTIFILFSPDCDHCSQLAKEIKNRANEFDSYNLLMISPPMPLFDIKMFAHINGLVNKKQITVGQDVDFFFGSYFQASTVPFVVIYDKKKKLCSTLKNIKKLDELMFELEKLP